MIKSKEIMHSYHHQIWERKSKPNFQVNLINTSPSCYVWVSSFKGTKEIGLLPVRYIPITIELSSARCVLAAIGLSSICCEVGVHRPPVVSFHSMLAGMKLSSFQTSLLLGDPTCYDAFRHDFHASRIFEVPTLLMVECCPLWGCSWAGSLARADVPDTCWHVLAIFQKIWLQTFDCDVNCLRIT